jgi:TolB protein
VGGYHQLSLLQTNGVEMKFDFFDTIAGEQYSSTWSPDGRYLIFNSSCRIPSYQFYIYDTQTGDTSQLTNEPYSHTHPTWSHDGRFLAYAANKDGDNDIFILDLETKEQIQLTHDPAKDTMPSWSPDDKKIAFVTNRDGNEEIYIMEADGSNPNNLTKNSADDWYPSWSPVENNP